MGRISSSESEPKTLGQLQQLDEIVRIYRVEEIIFCSRDLSSQDIMKWMSQLGPQLLYKILPEDSLSIIGSHSKNTSGELYTIDVQFAIAQPLARRNKRILDLGLVALLLLSFPLQLLIVKRPLGLLRHLVQVLLGKLSWVGYAVSPLSQYGLPTISSGVLNPTHRIPDSILDQATIDRLNLLYAKDYQVWLDVEIIWRAWRFLGDRKQEPPS